MKPDNATFEEWLKTRPPQVQALAAEFPLDYIIPQKLTAKLSKDRQYFVIGWTEDDHLIISHIDPFLDYDEGLNNRQYLCAAHLRELA
jgi:hypothetical protein